jgi:hypothetical protein
MLIGCSVRLCDDAIARLRRVGSHEEGQFLDTFDLDDRAAGDAEVDLVLRIVRASEPDADLEPIRGLPEEAENGIRDEPRIASG